MCMRYIQSAMQCEETCMLSHRFHLMDTTAYSDCVYQLVLTNACTRRWCHMLPVVVKVKVFSGAQKGRQNAHIFTRVSVYRWQSWQCSQNLCVPFLNNVHVRFVGMFALRGTTAYEEYNFCFTLWGYQLNERNVSRTMNPSRILESQQDLGTFSISAVIHHWSWSLT